MLAVEVLSPRSDFAVRERPHPEPGPGALRLKVAACGVCHSDSCMPGHHCGICAACYMIAPADGLTRIPGAAPLLCAGGVRACRRMMTGEVRFRAVLVNS